MNPNKIYKGGLTRGDMIERYLSGASMPSIADEFGVSIRGVRYIMTCEGVETRRTGQPRKHKVNEDFFKTWTNEMAWVLGMFLTDGNMPKNANGIVFIQKDTTILEKIARVMEADVVLTKPSRTRRTPCLIISSLTMRGDLNLLGIYPNKSLTVGFPPVPLINMPSFVRGVIDGDGWVQDRGYVMNVTSGSESFSKELLSVFKLWGLNSDITEHVTPKGTTIYRVWVRGKQDLIKLYDIIYDDSDLFVEKKKLRMGQHKFKVVVENVD